MTDCCGWKERAMYEHKNHMEASAKVQKLEKVTKVLLLYFKQEKVVMDRILLGDEHGWKSGKARQNQVVIHNFLERINKKARQKLKW